MYMSKCIILMQNIYIYLLIKKTITSNQLIFIKLLSFQIHINICIVNNNFKFLIRFLS